MTKGRTFIRLNDQKVEWQKVEKGRKGSKGRKKVKNN